MIELPKFLPTTEIYKDIFKPGMQKAGEALATVVDGANLILLPLKLINEKSRVYFQNNIEKYSEKLNNNTEHTLTQVPQYVGLPIIDRLTFLDQNELAEAFINLLAKASFEETLKLVHPSFIAILERISADEAKILYHFKDYNRIPSIDIHIRRFVERIEKPNEDSPSSKSKLQQMIDYTYQDREELNTRFAWNLTGIEKEVDLIFPDNIDLYLENLEMNGIITFERKLYDKELISQYENLETIYERLYDDLNNQIKEYEDEYKFEVQTKRGYIEFTELGKMFLKACIIEK